MKILNLAILVYILFVSSLVYAENGYVDLKYLLENQSVKAPSASTSQNLSGFGIVFYNKILKESDTENFVSYIEKSSLEKKIEKILYEERKKGTRPKIIAKLENKLFIEKEKRNRLMSKRYSENTNTFFGGSKEREYGVGIILEYKYLIGTYSAYSDEKPLTTRHTGEIGIRINW